MIKPYAESKYLSIVTALNEVVYDNDLSSVDRYRRLIFLPLAKSERTYSIFYDMEAQCIYSNKPYYMYLYFGVDPKLVNNWHPSIWEDLIADFKEPFCDVFIFNFNLLR